jgi:hypothetical protein
MTESGLSLLFILRLLKPTNDLIECTVMIKLSRALNLEFDCENVCTKDSITSLPSGPYFWNWFLYAYHSDFHCSVSLFRPCHFRADSVIRYGIDHSNWLGNGLRDLFRGGRKGANHKLRTHGTKTSILSGNSVLKLESANHGLQTKGICAVWHWILSSHMLLL